MDVKSNSHWRSLFHSDVYRKVCSNNRQNHKPFAYTLVRIRMLQLCVCHIPTKKDRLKCSSIHRFRFMFIILWGNIGCIKTAAFFLSNWNVLSKTWASVEFCVCTCRTHSIRLYVNVISFHQNFLVFFSSILSIDRERKPKTFHVSFSFFSHKLEMLWKLIPLMVFPSRADSKRNKKRCASDRTFILSIFAFFSGSRANPSEWIKQTCISSQTENLFSIYRSNVNMNVYACD